MSKHHKIHRQCIESLSYFEENRHHIIVLVVIFLDQKMEKAYVPPHMRNRGGKPPVVGLSMSAEEKEKKIKKLDKVS